MTFKCGESIGFVIFDCICLMLGAASLRSAATAEVAQDMAEAAKPVLSQLDKYIITIAAEESSKTEVATAVFGIISTIYSGGCIGAVIGAFALIFFGVSLGICIHASFTLMFSFVEPGRVGLLLGVWGALYSSSRGFDTISGGGLLTLFENFNGDDLFGAYSGVFCL